MSRKRTTYTAEFKAKVVLEVLDGEKRLYCFNPNHARNNS
jgi:transposase-like protein